MEVSFCNTVVTMQVAFCLVPKVSNSVDVIFLIKEYLGMIDPHVMKLGSIKDVVKSKAVSINNGIGLKKISDQS